MSASLYFLKGGIDMWYFVIGFVIGLIVGAIIFSLMKRESSVTDGDLIANEKELYLSLTQEAFNTIETKKFVKLRVLNKPRK